MLRLAQALTLVILMQKNNTYKESDLGHSLYFMSYIDGPSVSTSAEDISIITC